MTEQQQIPVEEPEPDNSVCGWCGKPAVTVIEIEKGRYTHRKGPDGKKLKILAKAPILAGACRYHDETVERTKKDEDDE